MGCKHPNHSRKKKDKVGNMTNVCESIDFEKDTFIKKLYFPGMKKI